jgi:hypothetical protein
VHAYLGERAGLRLRPRRGLLERERELLGDRDLLLELDLEDREPERDLDLGEREDEPERERDRDLRDLLAAGDGLLDLSVLAAAAAGDGLLDLSARAGDLCVARRQNEIEGGGEAQNRPIDQCRATSSSLLFPRSYYNAAEKRREVEKERERTTWLLMDCE